MLPFTEVIKKINQDKRLVPDLMKAENGNNFRAISESAILDVIDPVIWITSNFNWSLDSISLQIN